MYQYLPKIPSAAAGVKKGKGHYYARAGESLTHLGLDKLDEITRWSLPVFAERVQKELNG